MYFASNITIYKLFQIIILSIFFHVHKKSKRNSIKLLNEIALYLLKHSNHKFAKTVLINLLQNLNEIFNKLEANHN